MNTLGAITLVGYLALAGAAFTYGFVNSRGLEYTAPAVRAGVPKTTLGRPAPARAADTPVRAEGNSKSGQGKPAAKPGAGPEADSKIYLPADEPAHIQLIYEGADDAGLASFTMRADWGRWHRTEERFTASRSKQGRTQLDLQWGRVEITPQFGEGRRGTYDVRLFSNERGLVGRFSVIESGKQVKLATTSTPGLIQELVFYEPERRVTTYRVATAGRTTRKDVCGIVFIGKGWSAAEEAKTADAAARYLFPETQILVLPHEWMDGNDIGDVMKTLKRGVWR